MTMSEINTQKKDIKGCGCRFLDKVCEHLCAHHTQEFIVEKYNEKLLMEKIMIEDAKAMDEMNKEEMKKENKKAFHDSLKDIAEENRAKADNFTQLLDDTTNEEKPT